ncbi:hypothetical protein FRC14_006719 [Serendipita sp. 396]|nr:hypothetical protein FRC14_006719 [Serendipita sp. 396]KAG8776078.1 hypothetical protein FRC16_004636 [Serendipita sp. 398]KAG8781464.1 hypothetical protein FRC15_008691 [Serendipita sp. 397]KAG8816004.1 hypothetical protein FRC18_001210 [Serendipita sp. 400]KAG8851290.1 hypothetical protein FRC20_001786 [Serendipita sp. 405]
MTTNARYISTVYEPTSQPQQSPISFILIGIDVSGISKWKLCIKLDRKEEDIEEKVDLYEHAPRWIPSSRCQVPALDQRTSINRVFLDGHFVLTKASPTPIRLYY